MKDVSQDGNRRFNPKTGRYEDVVSSKGFRLPQLSLPKFSLFQTDRQIKDLTQSSKKAKRRSTEPAHKRVEKLKAENITRSIAEAESIARSALETLMSQRFLPSVARSRVF